LADKSGSATASDLVFRHVDACEEEGAGERSGRRYVAACPAVGHNHAEPGDIFDIDRVDAEDLDEGEDDTEAEPHSPDLDTRPILVVEGEGAAREMYRIVRQLSALREVIEPAWIPNLANRQRIEASLSPAQQRRVVMCWRQVGAKTRSDQGREQETVFPSARTITFARITMELLWPLTGVDPRRVPEPPVYKQSRYSYADQVAVQLTGLDLPDDEMFEFYMEQSTQAMPDLSLWYETVVAGWREREIGADIGMVDDLLDELPRRRLFHSPGAPTGWPLITLLHRLIESLDDLSDQQRDRCLAQLATLGRGYMGQMAHQWPIHPLVADAYDLQWYNPDMLYRVAFNTWSFRRYILNYIRWAPWST